MSDDIRFGQYHGEELTCTQCGFETPEDEVCEGVCEDCWEINQRALELHNAEHDRWTRMSDAERAAAIKAAMR